MIKKMHIFGVKNGQKKGAKSSFFIEKMGSGRGGSGGVVFGTRFTPSDSGGCLLPFQCRKGRGVKNAPSTHFR